MSNLGTKGWVNPRNSSRLIFLWYWSTQCNFDFIGAIWASLKTFNIAPEPYMYFCPKTEKYLQSQWKDDVIQHNSNEQYTILPTPPRFFSYAVRNFFQADKWNVLERDLFSFTHSSDITSMLFLSFDISGQVQNERVNFRNGRREVLILSANLKRELYDLSVRMTAHSSHPIWATVKPGTIRSCHFNNELCSPPSFNLQIICNGSLCKWHPLPHQFEYGIWVLAGTVLQKDAHNTV